MAAKKKSTSDKTHERIQEAYLNKLLVEGHMPKTLFEVAKDSGVEQSVVSKHYPTVKSIEKHIWKNLGNKLREILDKDETYLEYSAPEQLLAIQFTLIEVLNQQRSLVQLRFGSKNLGSTWYLDYFKDILESIYQEVFDRAFEKEEFLDRPMVSQYYNKAVWVNSLYIIKVWSKDESEQFQKTDAAIEKSTHLVCELFKKGPADTLIDFVKFAVQQKAY